MIRVYVPLDGSERAERAIPLAHTIAQALGGRLELAHVLEDQLAYGIFMLPAEVYVDEAETYLKQLAARYGNGETVGYRVLRGQPAESVIQLTRETPDAIVVISTHGRGDLGRAIIGSVADKIARGSASPVLLVRDDVAAESPQLHRVLVTLDGSRLAEDALVPAERLARATGAELHLLRVVPPYRPPAMRFGPSSTYSGSYIAPAEVAKLERRSLYRAQRYLDKRAEELAHDELVVTAEVQPGKPIEQIVAASARVEADLIVIASHGRGGIRRWMLGSVSNAVLQQARVPLMIVPNPESTRTPEKGRQAIVA